MTATAVQQSPSYALLLRRNPNYAALWLGQLVSIPFLARVDLLLVYVMAFLLTSVGLFFKPAKDATIPNIVSEEDGLLKANSLSSATDTLVDVLGYPIAGALVAGLGGVLGGGR